MLYYIHHSFPWWHLLNVDYLWHCPKSVRQVIMNRQVSELVVLLYKWLTELYVIGTFCLLFACCKNHYQRFWVIRYNLLVGMSIFNILIFT